MHIYYNVNSMRVYYLPRPLRGVAGNKHALNYC